MFEAETPVIELSSRLGKVGSIQMWDPWKSRQSVAHAKWWVSKIASLSYGNAEAANPEKLFQRIVDLGHLSCLEFVPVLLDGEKSDGSSLPYNSLRQLPGLVHHATVWGEMAFGRESETDKASAFLVECPIFVARQWMRHRSFSYLEMSRRYVKESKVPARFYGDLEDSPCDTMEFYIQAIDLYNALMEEGEPPELARRVLPVGMMTKFWCAGFDRDWEHFINLRSDTHAQEEIRAFANQIKLMIDSKVRAGSGSTAQSPQASSEDRQ
jgi:hypothetical protein